MTVKFGPHDTPIAYSMIEAANKLDPKRDWYHPFHRYFYFWVAFNNIYTIIAYTGSKSPKLVLRQGIVVTEPNGNVNIPKINRVASERDEIDLAFEEPKEPRSILDKVNDALKANSTSEELTVQSLAEKLGIGTESLSLWAANDEDFQKGLEKFRDIQDQGTFDDFNNRADATVIAMLLLETKNKHK